MSATIRFAVMSPFLDGAGIQHLIALFEATKSGVKRVLVTRCPDSVPVRPTCTPPFRHWQRSVSLFHNYWLPRAGGYRDLSCEGGLSDDRVRTSAPPT